MVCCILGAMLIAQVSLQWSRFRAFIGLRQTDAQRKREALVERIRNSQGLTPLPPKGTSAFAPILISLALAVIGVGLIASHWHAVSATIASSHMAVENACGGAHAWHGSIHTCDH